MAKKQVTTTEAHALVATKLQSSGLDLNDLKQLQLEVLDEHQTSRLSDSFKQLPSLKLNYLDPFTGKPLRPWPHWPAFYRLRYLKEPNDLGKQANKKFQKYTQLPDSGVCAYFPHNLPKGQSWPELLQDPTRPLIITEGELKAAKACREGYPTIGLGGVYNYRSSKLGISFLDELAKVNWVKRSVYVIYDSDFQTNKLVCAALNELAEELMRRGALPLTVALPDVVPDGKTGLDDYLVALKHPDELEELLNTRAQPLTLAKPLWDLNEQVVLVQDPGMVLRISSGQKLSFSNFKEVYGRSTYTERTMKPDGSGVSLNAVPIGPAWLKWPYRHEVQRLVYSPGQPQVLEEGGVTCWNGWPGWGCKPRRGDVGPFLELVDHLFSGAPKEDRDWFLRWCACPLQHPGTKLFTYTMIHGRRHGTGKSLVGYTLGRIYGKNFTEIKQKDLHSDYNGWAENCQFVLADDITGSDSRHDADVMKKMITQKEIRINEKYVPAYTIKDCVNYMFTSQHPDALFLEDDDRRGFVHEVTVGPLDDSFYLDYMLWLDTGGAEAVFDHLLRLDLADFSPTSRAKMTDAKARMISDVRSDLGSWVRRLVDDPDAVLKVGRVQLEHDLLTNKQLLDLYDPTGSTRTTANGLGRELRRAGVPQVLQGKPVKGPNGQDRYYICRNHKRWAKATAVQVIAHLTNNVRKK